MLSGILEVGWIVSLKATDCFSRLVPLIGYALFGFGAAFFLSLSMKTIPMGTAYATWVGVSAVGAVFVDVLVYKQPCGFLRLSCALAIVAATCGLKWAR